MESAIYVVAGLLAILGIFSMLFPFKTRESISSSSNTAIHFWGLSIIGTGLFYILLSYIYAYLLYTQPFMFEFFNPNVKTMDIMLNIPFSILRHFFLSSVFSLGVGIILIGIIVVASPIKVKRIAKESSDVKMRLFGLLVLGSGVGFVLIWLVFFYIGNLQKQLVH